LKVQVDDDFDDDDDDDDNAVDHKIQDPRFVLGFF